MNDVALVLVAALYGALYAAGVRALRRRGRPWPAHRSAAFAAGLLTCVVALASPVAARADELLSAHMWQHLALTLLAAPLLVAGAPVSLALRALRGPSHHALASLVTSRAARALTHPVTTWTAFAAVMAATHLTGWYDAALRDGAVHGLEHAAYLASALLFWAPVVGTNPLRGLRSWIARTIYLVVAMPAMSTVAVLLAYTDHVRYPTYAAQAARLGVSPLADQQTAGVTMWIAGSLWMVAAVVAIGGQALVREERRQRARDALEDAGGVPA